MYRRRGEKSPFSPPCSSLLLRSASVLPAKNRPPENSTSPRATMTKKTTGKKTAGKSAAAAAIVTAAGDLKKVHGDWQRSSMTERQLEGLRRDGFQPLLEKMKTRAPGDEVSPRPRDDERVCFVDF